MSAGVPPTLLMLDDRDDASKWTNIDKRMLLAWQTYQDELCKSCGVPIWLGHTTHQHVDFKTETTTCYSCQHNEKDKKTKVPEGGTKFSVPVPIVIEGEEPIELPSRIEGLKKVS